MEAISAWQTRRELTGRRANPIQQFYYPSHKKAKKDIVASLDYFRIRDRNQMASELSVQHNEKNFKHSVRKYLSVVVKKELVRNTGVLIEKSRGSKSSLAKETGDTSGSDKSDDGSNDNEEEEVKDNDDDNNNNDDDDDGNSSNLDWEAIASKVNAHCHLDLAGIKISAMECFILYKNHLDPQLNNNPWTTEEEESLVSLVEQYQGKEWAIIAMELGTNRTPHDCLRHYQQAFNTDLLAMASEWTSAEEKQLSIAISKYGATDWQAVAKEIPGRTAYQCYMKYKRSAKLLKLIPNVKSHVDGAWTLEEERRLYLGCIAYGIASVDDTKKPIQEIEALYKEMVDDPITAQLQAGGEDKCGDNEEKAKDDKDGMDETEDCNDDGIVKRNDTNIDLSVFLRTHDVPRLTPGTGVKNASKHHNRWSDVAALLSHRNDHQCRDKWTMIDNSISRQPFSLREDALLKALIDRDGPKKWSAHAEWFPGRSDRCLMVEWNRLNDRPGESKQIKPRRRGRTVKKEVSLKRQFKKEATNTASKGPAKKRGRKKIEDKVHA